MRSCMILQVADAFHMLSDIAALVVAFISVGLSTKAWKKNTFGWARAEILGIHVQNKAKMYIPT